MPAKTQPPADTTTMLISALAIPGDPEQVRTAREFIALVLRAHARADDGTAARSCGFAATPAETLTDHLLQVFTPEDNMVRPGKSGGRYICELLVSLPDSSAL